MEAIDVIVTVALAVADVLVVVGCPGLVEHLNGGS